MRGRTTWRVLILFVALSGLGVAAEKRDRGSWEPAERHTLARARSGHSATVLADGRIALIGGAFGGRQIAAIDVFDPATGESEPAGELRHPRSGHTATLLPDGRVLVAGGSRGLSVVAEAELFDPASGRVAPAGTMVEARRETAALALGDGSVLFIGGEVRGTASNTIERWTGTGGFERYPVVLAEARADHAAVALDDGRILVAGGRGPGGVLASTELVDPATASAWEGASLQTPRYGHTATVTANGNVVIIGGANEAHILGSMELYVPAEQITVPLGITLAESRLGHETIALPANGHLLIFGGAGERGAALGVEMLDPFAMQVRDAGSTFAPGAAVAAAQGLWTLGGADARAEKFEYGRIVAAREGSTLRIRGDGWTAGSRVAVEVRRGIPEPAELRGTSTAPRIDAAVGPDGTFAASVTVEDSFAPYAVHVTPSDPAALPALIGVATSAATLTATPDSFKQGSVDAILVAGVPWTSETTELTGRLFRGATLLGEAFVSPAGPGSVSIYLPAFVSHTPGLYSVEISRTERVQYQYNCGQYVCGSYSCNPYSCNCHSYSCGWFSTCWSCSTCYHTCYSWCTQYCTGYTYVTTVDGSAFFEVLDGVAPVISAVSASPSILTPRNHKMVEVAVEATVTDNTDPAPTIAIVGVSSNEGPGGGSGNTEVDWEITGPMTVRLRAEAAGTGSGRVYTIALEAADAAGNRRSANATVTVPHDRRK